MQDVWYQLYNTTEVIEQLGAWLYRVARNKIIDRYRKRRPESLDDQVYENEDGFVAFKEILLATDDDPELQYLKGLFWEALYKGLDELPSAQRAVFIANELEDILVLR